LAGNELIKRIKMISGRKEVGGDNVYICNKCRYHPKWNHISIKSADITKLGDIDYVGR